jgi:hypothetical protein
METIIVGQWILMVVNSVSALLMLVFFDRLINHPIPRFRLSALLQQFKSLIPDPLLDAVAKRERRDRLNEFLANEAMAKAQN